MTEKEFKEVLDKLDTIALCATGLAEAVKALASGVSLIDQRVANIENRMQALEDTINKKNDDRQ
jgi:hypothetical protein